MYTILLILAQILLWITEMALNQTRVSQSKGTCSQTFLTPCVILRICEKDRLEYPTGFHSSLHLVVEKAPCWDLPSWWRGGHWNDATVQYSKVQYSTVQSTCCNAFWLFGGVWLNDRRGWKKEHDTNIWSFFLTRSAAGVDQRQQGEDRVRPYPYYDSRCNHFSSTRTCVNTSRPFFYCTRIHIPSKSCVAEKTLKDRRVHTIVHRHLILQFGLLLVEFLCRQTWDMHRLHCFWRLAILCTI